ncbi:hypothetical protein ACH4U6_28110 [Streptomyces netropsis]|uniref:Sulfate adenylyltransferase n=1 Tax=Streptomyces netropsis TaxID=55404 RepID=A0A7W7PIP4_STRNE|nr:hypothetical protein [Streptomyces netropsis]MBB4890015.1 hypothetical protein [Streptomyces netropsis]
MGLLIMTSTGRDFFSTFDKEGGRIGSGALGSGQGGVGRCVR